MTFIDQATIAQAAGSATALFIVGGAVIGLAAFAAIVASYKSAGRVWPRWCVVFLVLSIGVTCWVNADRAAGTISESFAKNVAAKYETVGTIKLIPRFNSNSRGIKRIDLADGRAIISGTITIAESGEPTITDPVYSEAGDSVPVRR